MDGCMGFRAFKGELSTNGEWMVDHEAETWSSGGGDRWVTEGLGMTGKEGGRKAW